MTDIIDTTQNLETLKDAPEEPLLSESQTEPNLPESSSPVPTEEAKPEEAAQEQAAVCAEKKPEEAEKANPEPRIQFKLKSFTTVMIIINVAIFIATTAYAQLKNLDGIGQTCLLYKLGADQTHSMIVYGEYYRLVMPLFLHGGIMHICFNMLSLALDGYYLEAKFGTKRIAIFYFLAGIGGNLLSASKFNIQISLGASGALMGLFGLRLVLIIESYFAESGDKKTDILNQLMKMGESLLTNVIGTADNKGVDVTAHFGGFVVGAFLALRFVQWGKGRMPSFIGIMAIVMTVGFFLYCCGVLMGTVYHLDKIGSLGKVAAQYSEMCLNPQKFFNKSRSPYI